MSWSIVDAHRRELEARDLVVDVLRHVVDLLLERRRVLDDLLGGERLVGEGHVHHERRVPLGGGEVDEPALADQVEPAAVGQRELVDELARLARLDGERRAAPAISISTLKWPVLARIAPSFIRSMCARRDDVLVARGGAEEVADLGGLAPSAAPRSRPSTASSARIGSTSVTMTCEPMPRARIATPRPLQP